MPPIDTAFPHSETPLLTPTVAEIDLGSLRHNVQLLQTQAQGASLIGVVKANAYGHGALHITQTLQGEGVHHFAVATVPEGIALREAGIEDPILVFAAPLPEFLPAYVRHDLEVTVASRAIAEAVIATTQSSGPLRVHLKVDTGMSRIGVQPEEAAGIVRMLEQAQGVALSGLWTHFATATEELDSFAQQQMDRFTPLVQAFGDAFEAIHAAHTGAMVHVPASLAFDRIKARLGISLYGLANPAAGLDLRPVMRLTSRVTQVKTIAPGTTVSYGRTWRANRPARIATIGAGYADGYPRLLSNRAEVGINGLRYPVAGIVCMDMFMVNLGDPDGPGATVQEGDEVVLLGTGGPSTFEVAIWAETITYEICCGIAARVPRRYVE